jgi:hypothetical protein
MIMASGTSAMREMNQRIPVNWMGPIDSNTTGAKAKFVAQKAIANTAGT